jgi:hypothetical protein
MGGRCRSRGREEKYEYVLVQAKSVVLKAVTMKTGIFYDVMSNRLA